jgi:hypothetical protein
MMLVVSEVVNPFQAMAESVVDGGGAIELVDHIGVVLARAGEDVPFKVLYAVREFALGTVDFREAEEANVPTEFLEGEVVFFRFDEDLGLLGGGAEIAGFIDPLAMMVAVDRGGGGVNEVAWQVHFERKVAEDLGGVEIGAFIVFGAVGGDSDEDQVIGGDEGRKLVFVIAFENDAFLRGAGESF